MTFFRNLKVRNILLLSLILLFGKTLILTLPQKNSEKFFSYMESSISYLSLFLILILILKLIEWLFLGLNFSNLNCIKKSIISFFSAIFNFKVSKLLLEFNLFLFIAIIYPFLGANKTYLNNDRFFFSPSDTLYPFMKNLNFGNYLLGLDDNIYFGRADTNWSFLVKELPLRLFYNFFSENIAIRFYLMLIILSACISFFTFAKYLGLHYYVCLFGAVLWALNPQLIHWLIYTPNIAIFHALLPISLKIFMELLSSKRELNNKSKLKSLIVGLTICSDPTFGLILIIVLFFIFLFYFRYCEKLKFRILRDLFIIYLPSIFLIIFNFSGTISSYIIDYVFGNANISPNSLSNTNYTKDLINTLIDETDLSALINGFFGEVEALRNFSTFYWKFSTITMVLIFIVSLIFAIKTKKLSYLMLLPAGLLALAISLGKHLPGNYLIYNYVFNLPILSIMRYFYKWNIIVYLVLLIFSLNLINLILRNYRNKYTIVSICVIGSILLVPSLTYMKEQFSIHRSLTSVKLPEEYFEIEKVINSNGEKFRILYLPLNSWTTPERYIWSPLPGNQTIYPYLANLVGQANNLRPGSTDQHELTLAITNYIFKNKVEENVALLRDIGFNFIVFRDDVTKEIVGDGLETKRIIEDKFTKNYNKLIYSKNGFKVFDLRQEKFESKIFTNTSYKFYLGSSNNVYLSVNKDSKIKEINLKNTNQKRNSYAAMVAPNFFPLNNFAFEVLPSIFSIRYPASNIVCKNNVDQAISKLDYDLDLLPKLGNCFTIVNAKSNSKFIFIFNSIDMVSINIKLMSFISIILVFIKTRRRLNG